MKDCWRDFDLAVCRWTVKDLDAAGLPDAAVTALSAGCESPSLVRLACMDDATWSEFPPVVRQVYGERGLSPPSFDAAMKELCDHILRQIVDETIDTRLGTRLPYRLGARMWDHPAHRDLAAFIGLDDAFDCAEHGIFGSVEQVTADALAAAREVLARGGVAAH
jgi:hypothetical protein